ncbi:hypothetical protein EJ08DRAFT_699145 [Tothia fuscella]|uniref:Uncharacterized protein n=1 Tax=Tothia fuscella TaxID=1048955 RepID=A0A9P4TX55_9PEZI|nr:hypothetical protein EJ08DRAFT_699145 [Tothia fuscella]
MKKPTIIEAILACLAVLTSGASLIAEVAVGSSSAIDSSKRNDVAPKGPLMEIKFCDGAFYSKCLPWITSNANSCNILPKPASQIHSIQILGSAIQFCAFFTKDDCSGRITDFRQGSASDWNWDGQYDNVKAYLCTSKKSDLELHISKVEGETSIQSVVKRDPAAENEGYNKREAGAMFCTDVNYQGKSVRSHLRTGQCGILSRGTSSVLIDYKVWCTFYRGDKCVDPFNFPLTTTVSIPDLTTSFGGLFEPWNNNILTFRCYHQDDAPNPKAAVSLTNTIEARAEANAASSFDVILCQDPNYRGGCFGPLGNNSGVCLPTQSGVSSIELGDNVWCRFYRDPGCPKGRLPLVTKVDIPDLGEFPNFNDAIMSMECFNLLDNPDWQHPPPLSSEFEALELTTIEARAEAGVAEIANASLCSESNYRGKCQQVFYAESGSCVGTYAGASSVLLGDNVWCRLFLDANCPKGRQPLVTKIDIPDLGAEGFSEFDNRVQSMQCFTFKDAPKWGPPLTSELKAPDLTTVEPPKSAIEKRQIPAVLFCQDPDYSGQCEVNVLPQKRCVPVLPGISSIALGEGVVCLVSKDVGCRDPNLKVSRSISDLSAIEGGWDDAIWSYRCYSVSEAASIGAV